MSTSADIRSQRLSGTRAEGIALVVFTASGWGFTWPQWKFLLTMLPPFSMRVFCGVLGCGFGFVVAARGGNGFWPPFDQWPRLLLFSMLNYGLFVAPTTQSLV